MPSGCATVSSCCRRAGCVGRERWTRSNRTRVSHRAVWRTYFLRSRETSSGGNMPFSALIAKELRDLAAGRAFWVMLILLSFLVGTSFEQAIALYSEASRAAAQTPLLARGLSPFDGIEVPTFGALYLGATFLLPFVIIRMIGAEKASGALKLLLQLPYSPAALVGAKLVAALAAWLAMALVPISALAIWALMGGHIASME